jgi:hypothetical protein
VPDRRAASAVTISNPPLMIALSRTNTVSSGAEPHQTTRRMTSNAASRSSALLVRHHFRSSGSSCSD